MLVLIANIDGTSVYAGSDGRADPERYIPPWILSASPISYSTDRAWGGYCRLSFGSIALAREMFDGHWPPPVSIEGALYMIPEDGTLADKVLLIEVRLHRKGIDARCVEYDAFDPDPTADLLEETTDYNGDTVPLPRAFGTVRYVRPVRLPDASGGNQRYHLGYLSGSCHTDWHVFDDGVDICSNVGTVSAGVFELTVTPVGEVTISGTGELDDLESIFRWASGNALNIDWSSMWILRDKSGAPIVDAAGLPIYDSGYGAASEKQISKWADSQMAAKDFLSEIASYFRHMFFVQCGALYLASMDTANGTLAVSDADYIDASIRHDAPISGARATWESADSVSESVGQYVKRTKQETYRPSGYPYGNELRIDPMQSSHSAISESLDAILALANKPRCEMTMPLKSDCMPTPGMRVSASVYGMTVQMMVREIQYDFIAMTVTISGEADIA